MGVIEDPINEIKEKNKQRYKISNKKDNLFITSHYYIKCLIYNFKNFFNVIKPLFGLRVQNFSLLIGCEDYINENDLMGNLILNISGKSCTLVEYCDEKNYKIFEKLKRLKVGDKIVVDQNNVKIQFTVKENKITDQPMLSRDLIGVVKFHGLAHSGPMVIYKENFEERQLVLCENCQSS